MVIFRKYILTQILYVTFLVTSVLLVTIWLTQSLRFLDHVMSKGLSLGLFFKLSYYLLPGILSKILPISFFISILSVFGKLQSDSELISMRTLGLSNVNLISPVMIIACAILMFLYFLNLYLQPLSIKKFKDLQNEIRNNLTGRWIQPGVFNNFSNVTFYTKSKTQAGDMRGILIYDNRSTTPVTITAELGQIIENPLGLKFILFNGSQQIKTNNNDKLSIITFEQYSIEVNNSKILRRDRRPNEFSMAELLYTPDEHLSQKNQKLIKVEFHERVLLPITVFPLSLLAGSTFLLGEFRKKKRIKKILLSLSTMFLFKLVIISMLNNASTSNCFIDVCYCFILIFSAFYVYKLFFHKNIKVTS